MSEVNVNIENSKEFSAEVAGQDTTIVAKMIGTADVATKDQVDSLLVQLHDESVRLNTKQVDVDMTELEFMNSSCFKSFLTWVGKLQELPEEKRYHIRIVSNPEMYWQRRSLQALRCFATDLIDVDEQS